ASNDVLLAGRIESILETDGLTAWLDRSEIRLGALLRAELEAALRDSRVVILLWSRAAAASRWVSTELLTAFHLGHFIIPCALDRTALPYFLQHAVYLDVRASETERVERLCRAV